MTRKYLTIPAMAGAMAMTSAIAWSAEPTTAELMDQIKQLQAKVSELENRQTTLSDAQIGATIDSVLRDAENRSQLLQMEGFTAGHDGKHFVLKSADGRYSLSPRFQFQFRHTLNWSEDAKDGDDDETIKGFEIRRMKVAFVGSVCSPDLTYNFRWASNRNGGDLSLENAYIQYKFADQWVFKVGQWKDNWTHEESTSSERQLAADRSLLNEILGGGLTDYVQGVSLLYGGADSPFRVEFAAHDGANTDNTNFEDDGGVSVYDALDPNLGFSGRFEWSFNGNWKGYEDFTAKGNTEDVMVLGVGVDWTQAGDQNVYFHTVDFQWENTGGLGFYGAYVGNYVDVGSDLSGSGSDNDICNWGLLFQVGYMLNDSFEVFGRADWIEFDDAIETGDDGAYHEFTAGINYYFCEGHSAKMTIDFGYLPEGSPVDVDGIGVFATDESQFYVRGQFQLLL